MIYNIKYLWDNKPNNYIDCVNLALKRFSDNFNKKNYKNFNKGDSSLSKQIQSLIKRQI